MARIARGADVTQAALSARFESREQIPLAMLDAIYEETFRIQEPARGKNVMEDLHRATGTHSDFVGVNETANHAHLLLEFATSPRDYALRDALTHSQLAATKQLAEIIEGEKGRGEIGDDVGSEQLAWMMTGWSWALDIASSWD